MDQEDEKVQDLTSMKDRLMYIFEHEYKHDFVVFVGMIQQPSYGVFKAHQGVLAACSGVFRKSLRSRTVVLQRHLQFSYSHSKFFKEILRYMYTNEIEYDTPSDFGNIRQHAVAFDIPGLVRACDRDQNTVIINSENVVDWLDVSFKYSLLKLRDRCDKFISNNTDEVFQSKSFMDANELTFCYILKHMKILMSSELLLLETIMKWIEANVGYYKMNNYYIHSVTKYFLQFVKFISINARDFEEVFTKYKKFFSFDVALDIFKVITNPRNPLPFWMRGMSPRLYTDICEETNVCSGPNFLVQYSTFPIPMHESRVKKQLSSLQTKLRIRCGHMPTILVGATLICPGLDGKGKVKLHWECHTFGCFEETANTMSFERHVQVKKNQISIKFPKQFVLETCLVFNLFVKIEYDGEKLVDLPVECVPSSERDLFTPYGRNPYFDGDIIVSEILYL